MKKAMRLFSIAAALVAFAAGPANATVIIDATEVGGDGGSTATGSLDLIWGDGGRGEQFGVPAGDTSGTAIVSGMVFSGATLADFTLIPATHKFVRPYDTIGFNTGMNLGQVAVPEPTTLALLGLGLAGLGFARRKKA